MKPSRCLALIALLPLGCAGATPSGETPAQRPAAVTVVDLTPTAPPEPAEERHLAREAALKEEDEFKALGERKDPRGVPVFEDGEPGPTGALDLQLAPIADPFGTGGVVGGVAGGVGFGSIGAGNGSVGGLGTLGTGSAYGRLGSKGSQSQVTAGALASNAGIPKEIIQIFVRRNMSRFRFCYEKGLTTNPKLAGAVSVHFTILKDGTVARVYLGKDTTLTAIGVTQCLMSAFTSLAFPQPDGGAEVAVTYPLVFSPGEAAPPPPPAPVPAKKP